MLFGVAPNYFLFHLRLLSPTLGGARVLLPVQHEESPSKQGRSTTPKLNDTFISLKTHKPTVREFPHDSHLHSQQTFSTRCCVVQSWIRCTGCWAPPQWMKPTQRHLPRHFSTLTHLLYPGEGGGWGFTALESEVTGARLFLTAVTIHRITVAFWLLMVMEAKKTVLLGVRSRCTYWGWVWLLCGYPSFLLPKFYWNHLLPPLDLSSDP